MPPDDPIEVAAAHCLWCCESGMRPEEALLRYGPRNFRCDGWPSWADVMRAVAAQQEALDRRRELDAKQLRLRLVA